MLGKNESILKFSIFILGFTAVVTQIILLRFFLSVFGGNELIIGVMLANWLLLTALGAYGAKRFTLTYNSSGLFFSHLLLGLLPLVTGYLTFIIRNVIFPPGKMLNILEVFSSSFILLLPFCLFSGFLFTYLSVVFSNLKQSNEIYRVYSIESAGSIVGGFLFNFVFIFVFSTFVSLKVLLFINFAGAIVIYAVNDRTRLVRIFSLAAILVLGGLFFINFDDWAAQKLFRNQEIIEQKDTPYGMLTVTESAGQLNFYENGIVLFTDANTVETEENVHYAMLQHYDPDNVLAISGGIVGMVEEILKYEVSSIDYLEVNPSLIELSERYLKKVVDNKKINAINQDARLYLKKIEKKYDVILINLPNPTNIQLNRYYTLEFFEELKENLSYTGIVSISLSSSANYMSRESVSIHQSLYSTLKLIFDEVVVIPGQRNYFIASDNRLTPEISRLSQQKNIENDYVNHFYLDDEVIKDRQDKIMEEISNGVLINYDFLPAIYPVQMKLWLSKFDFKSIFLLVVVLVIIAIIIPQLNFINFGLFTTGFSALSLELLLLISFQIIYGYVYFMLGIFITVFMVGIVIGSYLIFKRVKANHKNFSFVQYLIGIYSIMVPLVILSLTDAKPGGFVINLTFFILVFIIGVVTGLQFSFGTRLRYTNLVKNASGTYSSDLLGSALGSLVVVTLLIPFFGLTKVFLLIGIFNFITGLLILVKTRKV